MEIPCVRIEPCNSFGILEGMLEHLPDGADIFVCSYAVTDVWLRRLQALRMNGRIRSARFLLDFDVMTHHRGLLLQLLSVCEEVYLARTHAKMILAECGGQRLAAVMSANATNNHRTEVYYVTDRKLEIESLRRDLSGILRTAVRQWGEEACTA